MKKSKVVYILGAGASKTIGLPLQSEILNRIFELEPKGMNVQLPLFQQDFDLEEQRLMVVYEEFNNQRIELAKFIVNNFASKTLKAAFYAEYDSVAFRSEERGEPIPLYAIFRAFDIASNVKVALEDLFTLFDKIILGGEHFRVYSSEGIQNIKTALCKCIIFVLSYYSTINIQEKNVVKKFAERLLRQRCKTPISEDSFSIITMNWDAYLEKILFQACERHNSSNKQQKVYPDLCFYDYCYDIENQRTVSTHIKAKGFRNIKLLKLHGSTNWLKCPNCNRIFVDYKHDIAIDEMLKKCYCPLCYKVFKGDKDSPQMHSILITPTFIKNLNNLHIKNIWHNAFIDLIESTKVVFIGYSFPDADFELRCLFKKAIKPGTEIDVVLDNIDNPKYYESILMDQSTKVQVLSKLYLPEDRYVSFFGRDMVRFYYYGMEEYVEKYLSGGN